MIDIILLNNKFNRGKVEIINIKKILNNSQCKNMGITTNKKYFYKVSGKYVGP